MHDKLSVLYQIPMFLQALIRGVYWRINPSSKVVYLTFDDGPIPEVTPRLLDILREEQVKATFFMVADNAAKYPDLLRRVREEGHHVGNHTYHHLKGWITPLHAYMSDVDAADVVLGGTRAFRPPYGRIWPWQKLALRRLGYKIYMWDVLTHDYNSNYTPARMLNIIKKYTRGGSIINFHDSIKSNERMLETVPEAIHWLKQQGYEFGLISERGVEC